MSTITTPSTSKPTVIGTASNGLLIVSSGHGRYLVHAAWIAASGSVAR